MKNNHILLIGLFLFFLVTGVKTQAQELLTVKDAVAIALENNYAIKLAANEVKISETSVSPGFAGMLPTVGATIQDNNSIQNLSQTRSDGTKAALNNAKNNSLAYGIALNWTVFDGLQMFGRYKELKELKKLSDAQLQQAILSRISDVIITYFTIVQQKQQLNVLDSTLVISQQRIDLANNRFEIGKASKLEVLNAKVDFNTDQTMYLRQQEVIANTKKQLNEILAREINTEFKVVNDINVDEKLILPELKALAEKQNPELRAQILNKKINELRLKEVKANRFPIIVASTGYNFGQSQSSLGFTTNSTSRGLNYGFSATLNLFDGFNQNRNEKIAKLQIENAGILIAQRTKTLQSQLETTYQTYLTNLRLIELEKNNEAIARENLDITLEKYKIGTIPTIEFRTAQLNYINAKVRYSNALFEAKQSEIILKELSGKLDL